MLIHVTQLSPDEWQKYREIRLEGLQTDPLAFGSSYEEEINFTETNWRNRINAMWFALVDGKIVGMIGLLTGANMSTRHCGQIISLWVKPTFRGQGIAKALVQKLQEIAPQYGLRKLSLQVATTQTNAIKLYEIMGFKNITLLTENLRKGDRYLDEYLMVWHIQ